MTAPRAALALALALALGHPGLETPVLCRAGRVPDARIEHRTVEETDNSEVMMEVISGNDEELEDSEHLADTGLEGETDEVATPSTLAAVTTEALPTDTYFTPINEDPSQLEFILMVFVPLAVLVILLLSAVFSATYFKRKRTKQEPSSQGSQSALQTYELGSENLKVPIFEEDTPSVMEIEMEELDKWMNSLNRNADRECLPTLKEEMEPSHSPRYR